LPDTVDPIVGVRVPKPMIVTKVKVSFWQAIGAVVAYLSAAVATVQNSGTVGLTSVRKTPARQLAWLSFLNFRFAFRYFWVGATTIF